MTRVITYAIGTEYANGALNTTFVFDAIHFVLKQVIERYWNVRYDVLPGSQYSRARLKFLQLRTNPGNRVAAIASKSQLRIGISPVFNFGRNFLYCARVVYHENGHLVGSGAHLNHPTAIMNPVGGTANNWTVPDAPYMAAYAWRSTLRPWHEPEYLVTRARELGYLKAASLGVEDEESENPENYPCTGCRHWSDYVPNFVRRGFGWLP